MEIFNVIDIIIELRNNGNWKFKRIENRVFFTKKKLDWFPTGEIKKMKIYRNNNWRTSSSNISKFVSLLQSYSESKICKSINIRV